MHLKKIEENWTISFKIRAKTEIKEQSYCRRLISQMSLPILADENVPEVLFSLAFYRQNLTYFTPANPQLALHFLRQ